MADNTLFGEANQALQGAGAIQNESQNQDQKKNMPPDTGAQGQGVSAMRDSNNSQDQQKMAILKSQLDQAENMMTMTPQIALGLVKNTGDKEWLKLVGKKVRSDVVLGFYTHGIKLAQQKKEPKVSQVYKKDGTVGHELYWMDDEGQPQTLPLDEGMATKLLNKKTGGTGSPKDQTLASLKEWNAEYKKDRASTTGINGEKLKATDPDEYDRRSSRVEEDQDTYYKNLEQIESLGSGGGPGLKPKTTTGTTSSSDQTMDTGNDDLFKF